MDAFVQLWNELGKLIIIAISQPVAILISSQVGQIYRTSLHILSGI